jgi:hypothetical protein
MIIRTVESNGSKERNRNLRSRGGGIVGCTIYTEGVEDTWNLGDVLSTALFSTLTILARARDEMFRTE